jgi:hypothetical protein
MDHQVEDLVDLGLELALAHGHFCGVSRRIGLAVGGAQGKHPVTGCQAQAAEFTECASEFEPDGLKAASEGG